MDFVHYNLSDGRAIRILTLADLWDRSCPLLAVAFSQNGQGVIRALDILAERVRLPRSLRADNGPESTCKTLKIRTDKKAITINYTRPGKPADNGHVESFNGRLRDERLNQHIFTTLGDAQQKIEPWREDYNQTRQHGALAGLRQPHAEKRISINRQS